jgi:hypothetical protein
MATMIAADDKDNNVDGDGATGNKVNDDGNSAAGRLLLMFLGTIGRSTRTPTGNPKCALFYYAVIVMNGSPSLRKHINSYA